MKVKEFIEVLQTLNPEAKLYSGFPLTDNIIISNTDNTVIITPYYDTK